MKPDFSERVAIMREFKSTVHPRKGESNLRKKNTDTQPILSLLRNTSDNPSQGILRERKRVLVESIF